MTDKESLQNVRMKMGWYGRPVEENERHTERGGNNNKRKTSLRRTHDNKGRGHVRKRTKCTILGASCRT